VAPDFCTSALDYLACRFLTGVGNSVVETRISSANHSSSSHFSAEINEAGLRSLVGRDFRNVTNKRPSGGSWFHEEYIVADESNHFSIAEDSILSKHLPSGNGACLRDLFNDEGHRALL
jgi:hypothetical protein